MTSTTESKVRDAMKRLLPHTDLEKFSEGQIRENLESELQVPDLKEYTYVISEEIDEYLVSPDAARKAAAAQKASAGARKAAAPPRSTTSKSASGRSKRGRGGAWKLARPARAHTNP